jgi:adenosylhomocysteine nucleosidase
MHGHTEKLRRLPNSDRVESKLNGENKMAQRTIGIIVAMPEEIKPLLKGTPPVIREKIGMFPVYRFTQNNREFVIIESGIGADRALAAAQALTEALNPELLISMGFGGGVSRGLEAGDIVIGNRFLAHKGERMIEETGVKIAPLPAALSGKKVNVGFSITEGTIISTATVQSKSIIAGQIPKHVKRAVVDMETCAVVRFATVTRMPLMAIRCISDGLDEELGFSMDEFMDRSMRVSVLKVCLTVARKPWIIPQLYRLSRNTRKAGKNLNFVFSRLRETLT